MHDLNQIRKMNELAETQKSQARARAMNNPGGHAKSVEKGQVCKRCGGNGRVLQVAPRGIVAPVVAVKCPDCA